MDKLKNIKIAFIDIDGTLSNSQKQISRETKATIKNVTKNGLITVLCSGRGNDYVYNYSKLASASQFIISCNGALIYDYKEDEIIYQSKMNLKQIKLVWEYCQKNSLLCILNGKSKRYCNSITYIKEDDKIIIQNIDELKDVDIYQIVVGHDNFEPINNLELFVNKNTNFKVVNASNCYINKIKNGNHYFLDITNNEVSKGLAINELLNFLNLKKQNAIGFGDHINDFELFDAVGFKVAMSNAMKKLKDKADFITLSNDDNGVAYFFNNFINYN